ncbi:hypothetical protein ccbrp13_14810 [Ktedonobacteria bacterium brp13]|nr:hypothetical protein ccbrp13_14810 [Ktedonobacteria bacterium brp13]
MESLQITTTSAGLSIVQAAFVDIKSATRARTLIFATYNEQDGDRLFTWRVDIVL